MYLSIPIVLSTLLAAAAPTPWPAEQEANKRAHERYLWITEQFKTGQSGDASFILWREWEATTNALTDILDEVERGARIQVISLLIHMRPERAVGPLIKQITFDGSPVALRRGPLGNRPAAVALIHIGQPAVRQILHERLKFEASEEELKLFAAVVHGNYSGDAAVGRFHIEHVLADVRTQLGEGKLKPPLDRMLGTWSENLERVLAHYDAIERGELYPSSPLGNRTKNLKNVLCGTDSRSTKRGFCLAKRPASTARSEFPMNRRDLLAAALAGATCSSIAGSESSDAASEVSRLASADPSVQSAADQALVRQRRATVEQLLALAESPGQSLSEEIGRFHAIRLLGRHRASEAAPFLVDNILYAGPLTARTVGTIDALARFPAAVSLVEVGEPAVEEILYRRMTKHASELEFKLFAYVLWYHYAPHEEHDVGLIRMQRLLDRTRRRREAAGECTGAGESTQVMEQNLGSLIEMYQAVAPYDPHDWPRVGHAQ